MKLKNISIKTAYLGDKHVGRRSRGHTSRMRQGIIDMLAREYVNSKQVALTCEYRSTHGLLRRESHKHEKHIGTSERMHARYTDT